MNRSDIMNDPRFVARLSRYPDRLAMVEHAFETATHSVVDFKVDKRAELGDEIDKFSAKLREYHLALYLCDERAKILASDLRADRIRLDGIESSDLVSSTKTTLDTELRTLKTLHVSVGDNLAFVRQTRSNSETIRETCEFTRLVRLCQSWSTFVAKSRIDESPASG